MKKEREKRLTHIDEAGAARMVDVSGKGATARRAVASGRIRMTTDTLRAIREGAVAKGDVLAVARVAGILAAKDTARIIPLCHPLAVEAVTVEFSFPDQGHVEVRTSATLTGKTGVEMEALVAASVALLTIYDMAKALDREMVIEDVHLVEKTGGKSGEQRTSVP